MSDRIRLDNLTDDALDALYDQLDATYRERAHLVAHLAALHPSHIGHTDPKLPDWAVVTVETPAGQMTWHIAERDIDLFTHVQPTNRICRGWDGHTTDEKYARMRDLTEATPSLLSLETVAEQQAEHIKQLTARVAELEHAEQGDRAAAALNSSTIKAWHARAEQAERVARSAARDAAAALTAQLTAEAAIDRVRALPQAPQRQIQIHGVPGQDDYNRGWSSAISAARAAIDEQQPTTEADRA
ncbi:MULTISPECIES: hypothetical protein [unclassified Streptomyces]|uniref:WDGH domain-containing protein n=1 Tax=unclassified Streptomyces TaxID=2593676 RepID=UPI002256B50C|nr:MULTISPECIES: hypothetical protein [unclassified Streptomyces]MCX4863488.1 hypothetical protein [Streptomyces sp. NBC_00906]MCX4894726.1 hypothetical protein [Streptomyces sp. NBC_00892]